MALWYARNAVGPTAWGAANITAQAGPAANASGIGITFAGSGAALVTPPVARVVTATLYDDAGALLTSQVCKVYEPKGSGFSDLYVGTATSDAVTGVISFSQTLLPANHVPLYFTGSYVKSTIEYTYRSELITPV